MLNMHFGVSIYCVTKLSPKVSKPRLGNTREFVFCLTCSATTHTVPCAIDHTTVDPCAHTHREDGQACGDWPDGRPKLAGA